jgi:hypothetical protein
MATCPNKNLDSWKNLVKSRGEDISYYLWDKYNGDVPESEYVNIKPGVQELFDSNIELIEKLYELDYPSETIEDVPAETSELDTDNEVYEEKTLNKNGEEPKIFVSNDRLYVMNPRGYYNLIDKYNNKVIFTDLDIKNKQAIFALDQKVSKELLTQEKRKLIEEIATGVANNSLDIKLALKDIDVSDLTVKAYKAESLEELDRIKTILLENIC